MVTRAMELRYVGTSKKGTCGLTDGEHYRSWVEVAERLLHHMQRVALLNHLDAARVAHLVQRRAGQ